MQENQNEIIERYLMGRLSLWELVDIETKIKTDISFAQEVSFQRDLMIGINESKRFELKKNLQGLKPAGILVRLQVDKTVIARISVAASIILLVTFSILYPTIKDIKESHLITSKMNLK